jgi:predicted enzyme related to lactoylglutathione lyase
MSFPKLLEAHLFFYSLSSAAILAGSTRKASRQLHNLHVEEKTAMAEQAKAFEMPAEGVICWNELASKDVEGARKFYAELLGWTMKQSEAGGMNYTEFQAAGRPVGGMYQLTAECGGADTPSHWRAYVAVSDVDASAKRVEELGGKICVPPMDIPNVGRFCVITDPTGASISLITMRPMVPAGA